MPQGVPMADGPVFTANIDAARNLVRVRFAGNYKGANMQAALEKVQSVLPGLKPGFTIFGDFSGITDMDLDSVRPLTGIMDACRAAGVGMIVRILPSPNHDIGIRLLGLVHYHGEVKTITVDTVAEAERVLH